jgi:NAD(P)-dependent dehydrogenase (short-subunit alcohol dehydrogenase family)
MQEMMRDVPGKRLGLASEVAEAVVWLCNSKTSFVTGQAMPVDGGYTVR